MDAMKLLHALHLVFKVDFLVAIRKYITEDQRANLRLIVVGRLEVKVLPSGGGVFLLVADGDGVWGVLAQTVPLMDHPAGIRDLLHLQYLRHPCRLHLSHHSHLQTQA